jgi:predicted nuclease of predicted toxin-antitoxin system
MQEGIEKHRHNHILHHALSRKSMPQVLWLSVGNVSECVVTSVLNMRSNFDEPALLQ